MARECQFHFIALQTSRLIWISTISLVEHFPGFQDTLRESLRSLVGAEVEGRVLIGMAKDGSGVGGTPSSRSDLRASINPN
jgi:hexokinase